MDTTLNTILNLHKCGARSARFSPIVPENIEQTGLKHTFIEDLVCKMVMAHGSLTGREIAAFLGLPLPVISDLLYGLKQRLILAYQSTSGLSDFDYILTETGREKALLAREQSNYLGSAPVTFDDYLQSIEKQSIQNEHPDRKALKKAFYSLELDDHIFTQLGPAINSGRGIFIYGDCGNGKTEIALQVSKCFAETIYIPKTIIVEGQLIQLYDPQCHILVPCEVDPDQDGIDRRWLKIERPAVVVGGEMDLGSMELGYNARTKTCEAPLQLKGNGGVFVIDDFGRQKVSPERLLNRWVLPLEKRIDYLTLPSGTKIRVPFNALLVFCSNIDPAEILDEAFLRRIPYKIRVDDPSEEIFIRILKRAALQLNIPYEAQCVEHLLSKHFRGIRSMRCCHPRDILHQLLNIAIYNQKQPQMTKKNMDLAVDLYFAATGKVCK